MHRAAGDTSKELDKCLGTLDAALGPDPKLVVEHRTKLDLLLLDTHRIAAETREFEKFKKIAEKFVKDAESALIAEESTLKKAGKLAKTGGKMTAREIAEIGAKVSADVVGSKLASKSVLTFGSFLNGWDEKIDKGLKVGELLLKAF